MARHKLIPDAVKASFRPPYKMAGQAFYSSLASKRPNGTEKKRIIIFYHVMSTLRALH